MNQIEAWALGERAARILLAGRPAYVIGTTSRGIFIVDNSSEVVFISYEGWHGPLSINLVEPSASSYFSKESAPFNRVQQWDVVRLQADGVIFPTARIEVQTGPLAGWRAGSPHAIRRTGIAERLKTVASHLVQPASVKGWAALFSRWIDPGSLLVLPEPLREIEATLTKMAASLAAGEEEGLLLETSRLLGKGEGLTPSGDDLVMGLLLVSGRYPELCYPLLTQAATRQKISGLARQKTTWLGACLVESAAEGQADERLVKALDGVASVEMEAAEAAKLLQMYGSSSGSDAFLGMMIAIQ